MNRLPLLLIVCTLLSAALTHGQNQNKDSPQTSGFQWVNDPPAKGLPAGVTQATFHSEANQTDVGYCIYLPPQYAGEPERRFPVVYWLHGGRPGSEMKSVSMAPQFDRHIRAGAAPPMIYVFPNGGKLSHYDHEGSLGEAAFLELIDHVDRTYRTIADRTGRAVEGYSQGGRGTARYLFKYPQLFCSAAPMDGGHGNELRISENDGMESESVTIAPPNNNTWDLARMHAKSPHPPLPILVVTSDQSFNFEPNKQWSAHLKALGIDHELIVVEGVGHNAQLTYEKLGPRVMQFHAKNFAQAAAGGRNDPTVNEAHPPLRLHWDQNFLTISGNHLPGGEMQVHYLEAYCRAGSTDADWRAHTKIPHRTELLEASDDGTLIRLRCHVDDGTVTDHTIRSTSDEVDFQITASNPTDHPTEAHWAQPCIRVDRFTGRDQESYLPASFVFLEGRLERMPTRDWASEARYTPGQVWCPADVPRSDVNPRPLSPLVPSNGLIGCFSADESMIFATAFEPYQELFQGVIVCLHADFRIGGLQPGERKQIRGKIYIVPSDVPALLDRYARDFPEHIKH